MTKGKRSGRQMEACIFCNNPAHRVERLIAGPPGVYICNECVELCYSIMQEDRRSVTDTLRLESVPAPKEIKGRLDEYVIGQERAKKTLAVAVHTHYKRILSKYETGDDVELEKSNILLIGPTGCGKTLLARTLAKILKVPFAIGDATTLTEAGYVGEDVENILLRLLQAADYNIPLAEKGIVFIDEIDKIGRTWQNVSITRDVSGEGVQQSLLKMLEGTTANIPPQGGRKHPEQQYIQMDTSRILFICGGAFVGLDDIIAKRIGKATIGFKQQEGEDVSELKEKGEILKRVDTDDLMSFGLIPELVGRLPVTAPLMPLDVEDLLKVMVEPKNAIIRQYKKYFEMEGAELEFTLGALRAIAKRALEKETGARAVRAIVEESMLDVMFDLPSQENVQKYIIDEEFIQGTGDVVMVPKKQKKGTKREIA